MELTDTKILAIAIFLLAVAVFLLAISVFWGAGTTAKVLIEATDKIILALP